jgi:hemolysin activation/secretion protein
VARAGALVLAIHAAPPARAADEPGRAAPISTAPTPAASPPTRRTSAAPPGSRRLDILEFRVEGATKLTPLEVDQAVYPFLGPGRRLDEIERARQALERAYSERGFHAVSVAIPEQTVREGVVRLVVREGTIGQTRVRGARYFSPFDVKRTATSVSEGSVPNVNAIVKDIALLNQIPDRRVVPALRSGAIPGTVDVDLNVEDTLPLHGSLELNDRYSASTTRLRLSGALRYDNLFQLGHSLGFAFQVAPQRPDDARLLSGSYLARFPDATWATLSLSGLLQQSRVELVNGVSVKTGGQIAGARATFTLPSEQPLFHTLSFGVDYKHFDEGLLAGGKSLDTPITYWPATAAWFASWSEEPSQTQLGVSAVFNLRVLGSDAAAFDEKRYRASSSFIYYRADASRSDEWKPGFQLAERVQGQYTQDALTRVPPALRGASGSLPDANFGNALVGSEQLIAGGAETVRGYLEAQFAGDFGAVGSIEARTPSLTRWFGRRVVEEWRFLAFVDGAWLGLRNTLPEQQAKFKVWSAGAGTRIAFRKSAHAALDVGVPMVPAGDVDRHEARVHFRVWTEF